ncbi:hypothetical protein SAMN04488041_105295 [Sulfitobacter pontiacus]|jgi:hypothetical protein|uniref:HdeA/HdeB family protein n=1 Tax=Sulfitobacter pontiacus TaxID=60137 RepID=A0A1H3ACT7_9RHOB|nr:MULTISPECIES: hypothetical protein [Sulfitobacter]SDX27281.1 hypothetical protein SAMN04488041_105295 [Sulfitobacter pontiacus]
MTNTFKTLAIAALMGTVSAPAFAAAHADTSMTCAEFNELSKDDQMMVASAAIAEIDDGDNGGSMGDSGRDTGDATTTTTVTAAEATNDEAEEGSLEGDLKAVEDTGGNTAESNMTAEPMDEAAMEQFMVVCNQNLDATVGEAAAGLPGDK